MGDLTTASQRTTLNVVMGGLMRRYEDRVPDVKKIIDAMIATGIISKRSDIENDHVAFRTMGVPHLGVQSLEKIFLALGYTKRDPYRFESKKLNAFWYSPPSPDFPRIFISELCVTELSPTAQKIITTYTDQVKGDPVDRVPLNDGKAIDDFLHTPMWDPPTFAEYKTLQDESEYAAWVIYNRYYLNHFTISVHNLPDSTPKFPDGVNTIPKFNAFLEGLGVMLNTSGGVVKTSPDQLLVQSSTVAHPVEAEFTPESGRGPMQKEMIPGSYVEFAWRGVLPQFSDWPLTRITRQHRRDGFEAQNADGIFDSTSSKQSQRLPDTPMGSEM